MAAGSPGEWRAAETPTHRRPDVAAAIAERRRAGHSSNWLGDFGEQWFATLCAAAQLTCARGADRHGIDWYVQHHSGIQIRTQIKTTENPKATGNGYRYWLEHDRYQRLRGTSALASPGLFVLVVVHRPHPNWASHYGRGSVVRATAYWTWASDIAAPSDHRGVTIRLPWENHLTPDVLLRLFDTTVKDYPWQR